MIVDGRQAFRDTLRNGARKYPGRDDARSDGGMIFPEVSTGFALSTGQTVFTIGSCFARNVEEALVRHGLKVPTADFTAPQDEAPGRPNRILNQYNPATMLQCVESRDAATDRRGLYDMPDGRVLDCLLATGGRAVTMDRAQERRAQIAALYRDGLAEAQVTVVTLGLIEAWEDREDGVFLNEAPPRKLIDAHPGRFVFHQMGAAAAGECVERLLDHLTQNGRHVVLTVSPVPLQVTFAGGDAVTRNAYSKAVLRVVAERAVQRMARVDYFPSFEMVTGMGLDAFGEDQVHVRPAVVERVIGYMVGRYLAGAGEAAA